jgi:hypothetical protein
MKKLLFLTLTLTLSSCFQFQEKDTVFKVENTSDTAVTNLTITTSENLDSITFKSIASNDYIEDFLSMKNNRLDGSYTLSYMREDGSLVNENYRYYTNGGSSEPWIRFEIRNDTTVVNFGDFNQ